MKRCLWFLIALGMFVSCNQESTPATTAPVETNTPPALQTGTWRAVLKSPGGDLPFRLEVTVNGDQYGATAHNAEETLPFDSLTLDDEGRFRMAIDHYDSVFEGTVNPEGTQMQGTWRKTVDHTRVATLDFVANHGQLGRFPVTNMQPVTIAPRWEVTFSPEKETPDLAVATFQQDGTALTGTFMTPTGDYRFLDGVVNGDTLSLSCFDGGHAFLFKAKLTEEGHLEGDFWSSDKWHEQWVAKPNPEAKLPDAMTLTHMTGEKKRFSFNFPDLEGNMVSQDDLRFQGKPMVISIFGSWCPNCNDEAPFLQELHETYKDQGLQVMGLAFEATGDATRDTRMLQRFKRRHGLDYLILLAGQRDKAAAGAKLPDINHVLAYPTTLFVDKAGQVVHIHTGFTGPGTGKTFTALKEKYHTMVRQLLDEGE